MSIIRQAVPPPSQFDLFDIVNLGEVASHRDALQLLGLPIFCLSANHLQPQITFENHRVRVEVTNPCSIHDHDFLIICLSFIHGQAQRGETVNGYLQFNPSQVLRHLGRPINGRSYELLVSQLERLKKTVLTASSVVGKRQMRGVNLIDDFKIVWHSNSGRLQHIEVKVANWLVEAASSQKNVLRIHPEYLRMKSGVAKAIYRVMRRYSYGMKIETLAELCGTTKYKVLACIQTIQATPEFPYRVRIDDGLVSWVDREVLLKSLTDSKLISDQFLSVREYCRLNDIDYQWAFDQWQAKRSRSKTILKRPAMAFLGYCRAIVRNRSTPGRSRANPR